MKKKLFIHIGAGKCGSSAIQTFLGENAKSLKMQGILIPGVKLDLESLVNGNQIWFFENGTKNIDFISAVKRRFTRLHRYMIDEDLSTLIVSAENLSNPGIFPDLFTDLNHLFEIKVICYVRRQDEYLISAWQQWYLKVFSSFEEYINELGHRVDWFTVLEPWRKEFGKENLSVRIYDKSVLINGNVIDDFAHCLDIDQAKTREVNRKVNRSMDEKFNHTANKYRHELFSSIHDNEFYQFLADIYGNQAFKNYSGSSQLTLDQRRFIVNKYDRSNRNLWEMYFSDKDVCEKVFSDPNAREVYQRNDGIKADSDLGYLLVGMFGLYKRHNNEIGRLQEVIEKQNQHIEVV